VDNEEVTFNILVRKKPLVEKNPYIMVLVVDPINEDAITENMVEFEGSKRSQGVHG
jgi:hypothetical protein